MTLSFSNILVNWYETNCRDLPWRKTKDSYVIWLSEIILQQTRVAQGLPYFLRFIERYPTVLLLAEAEEEEVLKLWQGLGYYSRARNLHAAAKMVVENYNGIFPVTYSELIKLKGVGVYTASAIASFSNNEPVAVVDGNVYRVLSRIFGVFTPINSPTGEKEFRELAFSLLNKDSPAQHNQAIMEFGALACTPRKASCNVCPFVNTCYAHKNNALSELPVKIKKLKVQKRYFNFGIIKKEGYIYIHKRSEKGIWQHLYQFPLVESEKELMDGEVVGEMKNLGVDVVSAKLITRLRKPHKLSHQHIYADFYMLEVVSTGDEVDSWLRIPMSELGNYPVPVLISNFIKEYAF